MPDRLLPQGPVTGDRIRSLLTSEIAEGPTLEFKSSINISDGNAKKKFCAEVASFANAFGGDIVFGVEERDGKAVSLLPLASFNPDDLELQLRQILTSNVDPAIPGLTFCPVELNPSKFVLVLRIPQSWNRPHMVSGDVPQFPVRDGNRRRSLNVRELGELFGLAASLAERMKRFRLERIAGLLAKDAPVRLSPGPFLVMHLLPQSAFDRPQSVDFSYAMRSGAMWPMHASGMSTKINFDGVLSYFPGIHVSREAAAQQVTSYVQLFRNGCIEAVTTECFRISNGQQVIFCSYEREVEKAIHSYSTLLRNLGLEPPIFVALTFIDAAECCFLLIDEFKERTPSLPIGRDPLIVPESPVYAYADTYHDVLQEPFDRIWQACGVMGSPNYKDGKWQGQISRDH